VTDSIISTNVKLSMIVYLAVNNVNRKIYVGYTTTSLIRRKISHKHKMGKDNCYFHNALLKYGFNNFSWYILYQGSSLEEIVSKEIEFIKILSSNVKGVGYNLTYGGEGIPMTEEIKRKIGIANSGKFGELNPFFGKTHSQNTKDHLSKIRKGLRNSPFEKHSDKTKEILFLGGKEW